MKLRTKRFLINSVHTILTVSFLLIFFVGIVFFTLNIAYQSTYVYGISMYPTVNKNVSSDEEKGDLVLISRYKSPDVGDIVIATPSWSDKTVIKRLVGKPGDSIKILKTDKYELYCNDKLIYTKPINEDTTRYYDKYVDCLINNDNDCIILEGNEYFIMGDNWGNTKDSLSTGLTPISKAEIIGKVDLIVDKNQSKFFAVLGYGLKGMFNI